MRVKSEMRLLPDAKRWQRSGRIIIAGIRRAARAGQARQARWAVVIRRPASATIHRGRRSVDGSRRVVSTGAPAPAPGQGASGC